MSTTTLTARAMSNAVSHRSADASRVNSAGATTTEDETDWSERSERGLMGQVAERSDYNKAAERARRRREERMRREREGAIAQKDVDRCGEESEIAMDRQKRRGEERERADAGIRPEDGPAVMDGPSTVDAISSASSDTCCSESVVHVASARKSIESAERYNVRGSLVVLDEVFDDYNYVSLERGRRESTVVGDLGDSEEEGKVGGESGNGEELTETEGEEGPRVTKPMNSSFPTIDGGKERRVTKTINTNVLTTSTINANTPSHPRAPENDEDDDDKSFTDLLDLYGTADDVIRRSIGLEPEDRIPFVFRDQPRIFTKPTWNRAHRDLRPHQSSPASSTPPTSSSSSTPTPTHPHRLPSLSVSKPSPLTPTSLGSLGVSGRRLVAPPTSYADDEELYTAPRPSATRRASLSRLDVDVTPVPTSRRRASLSMTRGDDEDKDDHEPLDTLRRRMSLSLLDEQHEREFGARGTVRRRSSSVRRGREEKPRRGRDEDGFEADAECGDWNDGGRVRGRSRDRRSRTSANSRRSNGPVTSCDELMGSIDLARHAHVARRSPASSLARLSGSRSRERERVTSVERRDRVQGLLGQVLETARTFKEANVAVKVDGEPAAEYPAGAAGTATVPIERGMSKDATGEGKEKKASGWSKMVRRIRSASQNRKVKSDEMAPPAPPVPTRENESKRGGLGNFRM